MKKHSVDNSDLEHQFSGVEPPKVIPFQHRSGDFRSDLNDLEDWLKSAQPWSDEKNHYLFLLAQIVKNEGIPLEVRRQACTMLAEYSDARTVCDEFLGAEIVQKIRQQIGMA